MRRLLSWLCVLVLLFSAGCSGDREKGIHKDKDKPRPPEEKKT